MRRLITLIACFAFSSTSHAASERVLIVLSSVDQLPRAAVPTGNYLMEVAVPVAEFQRAGYEVDYVSPSGKPALVRGNEAYGFDADAPSNPVLKAFVDRELTNQRVGATLDPALASGRSYRAVFYAGSLGTLLDVAENKAIADIAAKTYEAGGFIATTGHGCAGLFPIRVGGKSLASERRVACFKKSEDVAFFEQDLGWKNILPYHVGERAKELGAHVVDGEDFAVHVVSDARVVTGQNAGSVQELMKVLIQAMKQHASEG